MAMMKKNYYLASTGISDFWDFESNLLFLGPWCLTEANRKLLEKKGDYALIPSPWKPTIKIKAAADYSYQAYLQLLPRISEQLNLMHRVSYPSRYWQILVGPWLLQFIKVFFDRYKRVEQALRLFPDYYTHVLPNENCSLTAIDTFDFCTGVNDDNYNLRLFSVLNRHLNPANIVEVDIPALPGVYAPVHRDSWKAKIFNMLAQGFISKGEILLSEMYHLRNADKLLLKFLSGQKIGFNDFFYTDKQYVASLNQELRRIIKLEGAQDNFQLLLYKILPEALPVCYVERYRFFVEKINSVRIGKRKVVGSTVGWNINEIFKFFAADQVARGAKIIDFQHGCGYEIYLSFLSEEHSLEKDFFYSWGMRPKNSSNNNNKMRCIPNPHISRIKDSYNGKNDAVLFINTSCPKYQYRFSTFSQPEDMPKHIEDKKIFLRNINEDIKRHLLYRPYHDFGWGELDIIRGEFPDIKCLAAGNLVEHMKKARLVVIDHAHTTFIEALAINVPCVFYWDHDVYLMREEAEGYFDLLRGTGILHKDPVSAARKVNEIFDNPLGWWRNESVQSARDEFCKRYAYAQKDWVKVWIEELKALGEAR